MQADPIEYIGEIAWISDFGHIVVILTFGAALLSGLAYFFSAREKEPNRKYIRLGRTFLGLQTLGVFTIIGLLFYMLLGHHYEFDYVWKHSSDELPMRFILSCFWEGQEGSFLLWIFWDTLLAWLIIWRAKVWEGPVMAVFMTVQVFLISMLLGIYVGDFQLGSDPFVLIREMKDNILMPWTTFPDYLTRIPMLANGRGLNPLLQNYWMTIHPPTLFLGFASTLVPFAYAIAGLWKRKFLEWIKPALPWTFFGIAVLGTGILMGGAWAYEALSFGGFWAWDPVENASLVPWLVMVGAAHVMVINRNKGGSLFTAAFLVILTFVLILYSTFLTRSGVLGETSVHSFTGDGMLGQLLWGMLFLIFASMAMLIPDKRKRWIYTALSVLGIGIDILFYQLIDLHWPGVVYFVLMTIVMLVWSYLEHWPKLKEEEALWSREFWLFVGSLILLLSAFQITIVTSKPVGAILFGTDWTLPTDTDLRIDEFHRFQLPFAAIITILMAVTQFLKYKRTDARKWLRNLALSFFLALGGSLLFAWVAEFRVSEWYYVVLMFTTIFAVVANLDYWLRFLKGKLNYAGASVAHIGFGLVLLGALVSTGKSDTISSTNYDIDDVFEGVSSSESALLMKGDTVPMADYYVVYKGHYLVDSTFHFSVDYLDTKPKTYPKGSVVFVDEGVFEAVVDHETGASFEDDRANWKPVLVNSTAIMSAAEPWQRAPGEYAFTLNPSLLVNKTMGNVAEPSTRHYWNYDVYTHLQSINMDVLTKPEGEFRAAQDYELAVGDTAFPTNHIVIVDSNAIVRDLAAIGLDTSYAAVQVYLSVYDGNKNRFPVSPRFVLDENNSIVPDTASLDTFGFQFTISDLDLNTGKYTIEIAERRDKRKDFIVMRAIKFPFINILWVGCIVMLLGSVMAVFHRVRLNRKSKAKT